MRFRLPLVILAALGCTDSLDPAICPQTYEFGNYGCAQVVVSVDVQSGQSREGRFTVGIRAVDPHSGFDAIGTPGATTGDYPLSLTRWTSGLPGSGDTVSVWILGREYDASLSLVAADSVTRVIRFAPVGRLRSYDTVSLVLKRVGP